MTLIVYDWLLMLGDEIDLIWKRPRKTTVILYLAIRYFPIALACARIPSFALNTPPLVTSMYVIGMLAIMGFVQVLLQIRLYAMYNNSKIVLWMNAGLFAVETTIVLCLILLPLFHKLPSESVTEAYVAPLCYELYLVVLALTKSWLDRESSRQLGTSSTLDMLARGSGIYFISVACGMALAMILFTVASDYIGWLDLLANAISSIGGTRLILSVQKAFVDKMDECTQYSADVAPALTDPQFCSITESGIHSDV